jgi:gamma-glutamyl:cysteine ligase YbdK (ATP-grasp superfamily)
MTEPAGKPTLLVAEAERPGLFEAVGVEIEYMIVDAESLDIRPICDRLMAAVSGGPASEIELGPIAWSNELTLHVLEMKTNGPAAALEGLSALFHQHVRLANQELGPLGCRLMPGAVHPWMDPARETHLWPHEYNEVYRTFDRIFGCSGHGWSNLQSTHVNLPFRSDEEFARLHAAIRIVLPLIPGLSAASPYLDGRLGSALDSRMVAYQGNAVRVPSVSGHIIPEEAFTREQYEREILGRIYADLEPLDPQGVLHHEWANARGAIARFDRGAIEIRVIDAQECPAADVAVVSAVVHLVRALTLGRLADRDVGSDPSTERLAALLEDAILEGDEALVTDRAVLAILGLPADPIPLGRLWRQVVEADPPGDVDALSLQALETILTEGPLARRLLAAGGHTPTRGDLRRIGHRLCDCLRENVPLTAVP